jgi:antitoxin MazE7
MLSELAREGARDAIFRLERDATQADAQASAVSAEEREWETTLGDGTD